MKKIGFGIACLLMVIGGCGNLTVNAQRKIPAKTDKLSFKIDKSKPGLEVYFLKRDKRTPLRKRERGFGYWLEIKNNLKYNIDLCAFGISTNGESLIAYNNDTQIGLQYGVEISDFDLFDPSKSEAPIGYVSSTCHVYTLKRGKSLIFSVPEEHLVQGLAIKIRFSYEWEEDTESQPVHYLYFDSASIPESARPILSFRAISDLFKPFPLS